MAKQDRPQMAAGAVISLPQPPLRKTEEYLKAYTGYAFTAISAIAQELGSIELKLFEKKFVNGEPVSTRIYEHGVLSLLHFINPLTTFYDQVEATQIYEELTGEAFWILLKEGDIPKEIWQVRPDWMRIVPDKKEIVGHYLYRPGGSFNEKVIIPKENVIHFKYFNPLNPYRGKGSVQAAAMPLDTHAFAQEWNRNFYFNSAIPGLVFTTDKKLNKKIVDQFLAQWQTSYGGRSKSNKVAFLGNGMKLDKTTVGAKEMDFAKQQAMMRDDILAVFKVPKTILGLTEDVNRANADSTTRSFMERVITPRMRKFAGALNEFLLPMYPDSGNLFFDFVDPAPEDVEIKLKRYANARRYTWMTPNEIRLEEGFEPQDGGDDIFAPLAGGSSGGAGGTAEETGEELDKGSRLLGILRGGKKKSKLVKKSKPVKKAIKHMMPIPPRRMEEIERDKLQKELTKDLTHMIGEMLKAEDNENEKKEQLKFRGVDSLFNEEGKDAYWKQFIEVVTEREEELKDVTVRLFEEQEKIILERLEEVKHYKKDLRKGKESSILPTIEELAKTWTTTFMPIVRDILIEQGGYVLDFLGAGGNIDLLTETAARFLRTYGLELVLGINKTTRDLLRESLAEGFIKGESVPQLRERVEHIFSIATKSRAEMIARTEALRASNFATVEAYRQSGVVEAKEWLTERDDRVCPFCLEMDGKVIGLDDAYFDDGDKFTANGDSMTVGPLGVDEPPLHPRCRCTTIPVLLGQKTMATERKVFESALKKERLAKTKLKKKKDEVKKKSVKVVKRTKKKAKSIVKKADVNKPKVIVKVAEKRKVKILGKLKRVLGGSKKKKS